LRMMMLFVMKIAMVDRKKVYLPIVNRLESL
jgi:hypothetical protein